MVAPPLQGGVTYLIGPLHMTDRPSQVSELVFFLKLYPMGIKLNRIV